MRLRNRFAVCSAVVALTIGGVSVWLQLLPAAQSAEARVQTDVDRAEHLFDAQGVPYLKIENVGEQRHPAGIAVYALAYAGVEVYDPKLANLKDDKKFDACIAWLERNLKRQSDGLWIWEYHFANTYNDITIKAPWASAFAQAVGIQALLTAYSRTREAKYLHLAKKAARPLFVPIKRGGFLFQSGPDIWFEEIPQPAENPSHILNGHMRVLLALRELGDATGDEKFARWFKRGVDTLYRWLPRYDTGYWLRYDLNPRKKDLLFRLANPYGFANHPLAVDKITLRDPVDEREVILDVGADKDGEGPMRIAGIHWGQPEQLAGRKARRLVPAAVEDRPGELTAPHSYFYLPLPAEWTDNLRDDWYELIVDYYDDAPANIAVQMRSVAPGETFRDLRDGDLRLTGAKLWRRWIVPIRPSDLGYWVGQSYAEKHADYLGQLAKWDARFAAWNQVALGYLRLAQPFEATSHSMVVSDKVPLPKQTVMQPIFDLDRNGVIRQFNSAEAKSGVYQPYVIAEQLLTKGDNAIPANSNMDKARVEREPALRWLLDSTNFRSEAGAHIYLYRFDNVYNDVVTKQPWPSAFGQASVLKALIFAAQERLASGLEASIGAAARAFGVPVRNGGIQAKDRGGLAFFEEVPNATHVLNAHLFSVVELSESERVLKVPKVRSLAAAGVATLRENLHFFDAGYWLKYDQNPKKELLFQLDWLGGERSPLIHEVLLQNPQTGHFVRIDVGGEGSDKGTNANRISGSDWRTPEVADGKGVRSFRNGYSVNAKPVAGGSRHNVYLWLTLPDRSFANFFDVPVHRLVVRYKDVAPGRFGVKVQSIYEGNRITFIPLRAGVWKTAGDQEWKEVSFPVRPQDMGWYKGPDYQQYEVEQLQRIANLTNDWFFYQYADRQRDYLDAQRKDIAVIRSSDGEAVAPPIRLKVVTASSTYPGHGFENSVDDDPNADYTAGIENQPGFVVLNLGRPADLAALRLHWENEKNISRHVVVSAARSDNGAGKVLAEAKNIDGLVTQLPLSNARNVDVIRIDFSDFRGQPRVLLRQIEVIEDGAKGDSDSPYLGARDERNPLHIFRVPVTQRIKVLSDQLAAGSKSEHEKILRFMTYISQFQVGFASNATPDAAVQEHIGACGTFTNTLLAFASAQGIDGRVVVLMNYPKSYGHVAAELFVSGQWRLYDATYGAYYLRAQTPDALPLSFSQIRAAYRKRPSSVRRIAATYRPSLDEFTGKDIFIRATPAGVIGPDMPMVFPLKLDLKILPTLDTSSFGPGAQGADFIGAASTNQNQEWRLTGLTPGQKYTFTLTPDQIGGDMDDRDRTFRLAVSIREGRLSSRSQHLFDFSHRVVPPWKIAFTAAKPEVLLRLTHRYHGPDIRFMTVARYALERQDRR